MAKIYTPKHLTEKFQAHISPGPDNEAQDKKVRDLNLVLEYKINMTH